MSYICPRCAEQMNEVCATCGFVHTPNIQETLKDELVRANTRVIALHQAMIHLYTQINLYGNHIPSALKEDLLHTINEVI